MKSIYLVPHGGVILPGMEPGRDDVPERKAAANKLYQLMEKVGQEIQEEGIELIFLTSPHGYLHPTDVQVVFNSVLEGWQYYHEKGEVKQQIFPAHSQVAQIFFHLLQDAGVPSSPVILADANFPIKISWGEGVPLHFISTPEKGPQVVLFSLPINSGENGDTELMDKVASVFLSLVQAPIMDEHNISLIISGDLSHRHDAEHEYGFHPSSTEFDATALKWSQNPDRNVYNQLLNLHEDAASCGIFGMGIIQKVLEDLGWKNDYSEYALPTYFGMMVSKWSNGINK